MYPSIVTLLKTMQELYKKGHQHGCLPLKLLEILSRMNYVPSDQLRYS